MRTAISSDNTPKALVLVWVLVGVFGLSSPFPTSGAPVPVASPATFVPIYFSRDSFGLNESGLAVVRRYATYLEAHPDVQVLLKGHTPREGTLAYELVLGEKRARTVRLALINLGVSPARLHTKFVGRAEAVCQSRTEACRWKNRRVTLERVAVPASESKH